MKGILIRAGIVAAALMLVILAARAADLPYKAPPMSPPYSSALLANWSGGYIGINGGYGFGSSDWDFPVASISPEGWLAGGTLGYNFQRGAVLWGVEGDVDYSNLKGSIDCPTATTCESRNTWLATARARLGYAGFGNWLPYFTGGAAFGDIKASNSAIGEAHKVKFGWVAGAGIEYAMLAHWSLKVEYLYVDLGGFDCAAVCGAATDNVSLNANIARMGLNYRF
jgi:outer membrane immunogenic protein